MQFRILQTITWEVERAIRIDLVALEDYLNARLRDREFGASIGTFYYGFEFFDFAGEFAGGFVQTKDYRSYRWKDKALISVGQIDAREFTTLDVAGQFQSVAKSILYAIANIGGMKRKPRDFRYMEFKEAIDHLLQEYASRPGGIAELPIRWKDKGTFYA